MTGPVAAEVGGEANASHPLRATLIGFTAVLMWAVLALLTTLSGAVPPFQLVAMSFAVAFALAAVKWVVAGENPLKHLHQAPAVWLVGVYGLFGYHALYFTALRSAPAVEASLIAYLAPLLIILFSAFLPGERLRWFHLLGALAGLAGAAVLVTGGKAEIGFKTEFVTGYLAALACALIWSSYSVLSRRFAHVPTDIVGGYCGAAALIGLACHLVFETTVWPQSAIEWFAVAGLGLGPVGAAFFTWDHGCKRGDIKALGASMYAAPLLSTIVLIAFGKAALTWAIALACLLITGGAAIAAAGLFRRSG
jgi:drug/metabolite transporter (DMT)-like permease